MLVTDLEMDEEGMTVPYPSLFDDIRKNHGFTDVRGRPDLASQIAEGLQSPAIRNLLIKLAQPDSELFSLGCDVGTKHLEEEKLHYSAGGYIQIMSAAYADRSPEDYARFAEAVAKTLERGSQGHEWQVHFHLTPVCLTLDEFAGMTGSLWIWFHAFASDTNDALNSRETLIGALEKALFERDHVSLFDA